MILLNPWVGYLERSYQQIKNSLINRLTTSNPEITDYSEGNILVVIISMFSGVAEMLGYYIDNMAREAFIETAQRYTSMVRLVKILDYRIRTAFAAGVDIEFTFLDGGNLPIALGANYIIPGATIVQTSNGIKFQTDAQTVVLAGATSALIPCHQVEKVTNPALGITDGTANQHVLLGANAVHHSTFLVINGVLWTEVNTFAFSNATSRHYIVDVDTDGLAYIIFGDGVFGMIPPNGFSIYVEYYITGGSVGNSVNPNTITTLVSVLTMPPGVNSISVTNPDSPNGGSDYEGFELIRRRAPLFVRTLQRAVTFQDFEDVAILHPSVQYAKVDFCCSSTCAKVYIAPTGGGIASLATLQAVQDWMDCRRTINVPVCVKAAGITHVKIKVVATAKFRMDPTETMNDIIAALVEFGSFENSDINRAERYSDILTVIDQLQRVDFANITEFYTNPYARPFNSNTQLNWVAQCLLTSNARVDWRLEYLSGNIRIFRNGTYMGQVAIGVTYTDPNLGVQFTVNSGTYSNGMKWDFVQYASNQDIPIDDFTVPVIEPNDIFVTVNPNPGMNCKPACNHP